MSLRHGYENVERAKMVPLSTIAELTHTPILRVQNFFKTKASKARQAEMVPLYAAINYTVQLEKFNEGGIPKTRRIEIRIPLPVVAASRSHAKELGMTSEFYFNQAVRWVINMARGSDMFRHTMPLRIGERGVPLRLFRFDRDLWASLQIIGTVYNCTASDALTWALHLYRENRTT